MRRGSTEDQQRTSPTNSHKTAAPGRGSAATVGRGMSPRDDSPTRRKPCAIRRQKQVTATHDRNQAPAITSSDYQQLTSADIGAAFRLKPGRDSGIFGESLPKYRPSLPNGPQYGPHCNILFYINFIYFGDNGDSKRYKLLNARIVINALHKT